MAEIPDDLKPLAAIGVGASVLVFLVLLHGAGLHRVLAIHRRGVRWLQQEQPYLIRANVLFGWAVFLMLFLHLLGTAIWALSLVLLGLVPHVYNAIYFCANAYTTLGFGSVDLDDRWRNISPIIGISGLFTFAWTTSALVSVVTAHGQLVAELEDKRAAELQMRLALLKDQCSVVQSELQAERLEREKIRAQLAGASFFQFLGIWRNERNRINELRRAAASEIAGLRRKEREEEKKLLKATTKPPDNPRDGL
jgi:hypothetical protein